MTIYVILDLSPTQLIQVLESPHPVAVLIAEHMECDEDGWHALLPHHPGFIEPALQGWERGLNTCLRCLAFPVRKEVQP